MKLRSKKMAIIMASIYVVVVFHAMGFTLSPESGSLSAVPAMYLTLPWSLFLMTILYLISPATGTIEVALFVFCLCALLNAMIIYRLFR